MAVYLHLFETEAQFQDKRTNDYYEPWASLTKESNDRVDYNKTEYEKLFESPLTFEFLENGSVSLITTSGNYRLTIQYKKNDGDWTNITFNTGTTGAQISVSSGDTIQFRGNYSAYTNETIRPQAQCNVMGNIMSMFDSTNFTGVTSITGYQALKSFFSYSKIVNAEKLLLPATTLTTNCYNSMFLGCSGLTIGPEELPATSAGQQAYQYMFSGCTNLIKAPTIGTEETVLDAYTCRQMFGGCTSLIVAPDILVGSVDDGSLMWMFQGCTSLTGAAKLPNLTEVKYQTCRGMYTNCTGLIDGGVIPNVAILDTNSFAEMFVGCTSLTKAPKLMPTTLGYNCYSNMFAGCTSLTKAPALPATALSGNCYYCMFSGCTSLTKAPVLPATTLYDSCYSHMFKGCTSLTTAPALPATGLASNCYYSMFSGCTSLTKAPVLPATELANYCYASMFKGCTSLTTAPALPATGLASNCYYSMFSGCISLTTAPAELPATGLASYCYYYMFLGCTSLTTAPVLPATELVSGCYYWMFSGCSALNYIKAMFTAKPSVDYTNDWIAGVSSTGTFVKNSAATWTGYQGFSYGIPSNWTVETASA